MAGDRRKVVVCGATGFIGRNLVERLLGRPDLRVAGVWHRRPPFDLPGLEWIQADLREPEGARRAVADADVVIHAAATTSGAGDIVARPHIHVTDNAVMGSLLFRAAFDAGVGQVVFFGCSIIYPSSDRPLAEDDFDPSVPMEPRYFGAGWTKVYLEKQAEFYARQGRGRWTVLRHSNVYGPHDKYDLARSHMFGATVTKAMTARDGRLVVWGDGGEARDLLHVSDLVDAVEAALARQPGPFGTYNIGAGVALPVREVVGRIAAASGRDLEIVFDTDKPTIPTRVALDCARAERELGWRPTIGLDEGIRRTLDWWRANVDPAEVVR